MSGHGGARKNAGRKPVELSPYERIAIGARCDELRRTEAEKAFFAKTEKNVPKKVRELQKTIADKRSERAVAIKNLMQTGRSRQAIRALIDEFQRYDAHALKRIEREITPVLDKMKRTKPGAKRKTRAEICDEVAKEYREQGRPEITPRRVKAYWTEYGNLLKAWHST